MKIRTAVPALVLALVLALCAFGQTTDVSALPGAHFFATTGIWGAYAKTAIENQTQAVGHQNTVLENNFKFQCSQWANDANNARNAKQTLPLKPVPPAATVLVRQDVEGGAWVAEVPGPTFASCADLAPAVVPTTGGGIVGPNRPPSNEEMLAALAGQIAHLQATADGIAAAVKKPAAATAHSFAAMESAVSAEPLPSAGLSISGPIGTIVDAGARVLEAITKYAATVRETESQASRDMEDQIRFQAYWDWRNILQFVKIVGEPKPWPPVATK